MNQSDKVNNIKKGIEGLTGSDLDPIEKELLSQPQMQITLPDIEVDYEVIHASITEGYQALERRKIIKSNLYFIFTAIVLMVLIITLIMMGHGIMVLVFQGIIIFIGPIIIPFALLNRRRGGVFR